MYCSNLLFRKLIGLKFPTIFFFFLLIISVLFSCEQKEKNVFIKKLKNDGWSKDSFIHFEFEVKKSGEKINFLYQVQYDPSYPYQNIWLKYKLSAPGGAELVQAKDNLFLFDPASGKPTGEYSKKKNYKLAYFLKEVVLEKKGKYTIDIHHYMRPEKLEGIQSLGLVLERLP